MEPSDKRRASALDKFQPVAQRAPNIGIVNAYNDLLSAHAPLQHHPASSKKRFSSLASPPKGLVGRIELAAAMGLQVPGTALVNPVDCIPTELTREAVRTVLGAKGVSIAGLPRDAKAPRGAAQYAQRQAWGPMSANWRVGG